jgi:DNA-binding beta-propeller fold protein YncE
MTTGGLVPVLDWFQPPVAEQRGVVSDVAVAADGEVLVLCRAPGRVLRFESDGTWVGSWGEGVLGPAPHGISVSRDTVYCADAPSHVIRMFGREGALLGQLGDADAPADTGVRQSSNLVSQVRSIQRSAGPFNLPTKAVETSDGGVLVSDGYGNARVHRFDANARLRRSWGRPGAGVGAFRVPHDIHVTSSGEILVCDRENERIHRYSPEGLLLDTWTEVQRPAALVEEPDGGFLVAELGWSVGASTFTRGRIATAIPARLTRLGVGGDVRERILSPLGDAGTFGSPHGIAVDPAGDVYVADLFGVLSGRGTPAVVKLRRTA